MKKQISPLQTLRNERGSIAVVLGVGVVLFGVITAGVMQAQSVISAGKTWSDAQFAARLIRSNFAASLGDDRAWQKTRLQNPDLACFDSTPTTCDESLPEQPLTVISSEGFAIYDPKNPTAGFNLAGAPCLISDLAGDDLCPFRIAVSWKSSCATGAASCPGTQIPGVTFRLIHRPKRSLFQLNHELYEMKDFFNPSAHVPLIGQNCQSMGGTIDPATNRCVFGFHMNCPPGHFVAAVTMSKVICEKMRAGQCPPGKIVRGVDPIAAGGSGAIDCVDLPK